MALFACIAGCRKGRLMGDEMSASAIDDDDEDNDDDDVGPQSRTISETPAANTAEGEPIPMITRQPTANQTPSTGGIGTADGTGGNNSVGISKRGFGDTGPDFGPNFDDGGWFWGDSVVKMADGQRKQVKELRKGNTVMCDGNGGTANVVCVLVMPVHRGSIQIIDFNDRTKTITQHPILFSDSKIGRKKLRECKYVYNVFLDGGGTILVNDIPCVALGHGLEEEVPHEFWGNRDALVDALCGIGTEQFEEGRVLVSGIVRDAKTGRVCGLRGLSVGKY